MKPKSNFSKLMLLGVGELICAVGSEPRYLISPILAGALLAVSSVKLLLMIDICTFFPTVIAAAVVRKNLAVKPSEEKPPFWQSLRQGWAAIAGNQGILILVAIGAL